VSGFDPIVIIAPACPANSTPKPISPASPCRHCASTSVACWCVDGLAVPPSGFHNGYRNRKFQTTATGGDSRPHATEKCYRSRNLWKWAALRNVASINNTRASVAIVREVGDFAMGGCLRGRTGRMLKYVGIAFLHATGAGARFVGDTGRRHGARIDHPAGCCPEAH
jgi:hypothetical protein